jgi:hypothetical protein
LSLSAALLGFDVLSLDFDRPRPEVQPKVHKRFHKHENRALMMPEAGGCRVLCSAVDLSGRMFEVGSCFLELGGSKTALGKQSAFVWARRVFSLEQPPHSDTKYQNNTA